MGAPFLPPSLGVGWGAGSNQFSRCISRRKIAQANCSLFALEETMQMVRLWKVTSENSLVEFARSEINFEHDLEDWLEKDISLLDPDLLVIGRQVPTAFGGRIDLLCLDINGDTVVIEIKKGQTPREVTAQALDYASWVKDLGREQLIGIAEGANGISNTLANAFEERFHKELPDVLNATHRSVIVSQSTDFATERIVRYLSSMDVPINAATIQHFEDGSGNTILAQVYLLEPQEVVASNASTSKRRVLGTVNGLQKLADESGVGELYARIREGVRGIMTAQPYNDRVWYRLPRSDGSVRTALIVNTSPNQTTRGLGFTLHATRFQELLGVGGSQLRSWLPPNTLDEDVRKWAGSSAEERNGARGLSGIFDTEEDVDKFLQGLKGAASAFRTHVPEGIPSNS